MNSYIKSLGVYLCERERVEEKSINRIMKNVFKSIFLYIVFVI